MKLETAISEKDPKEYTARDLVKVKLKLPRKSYRGDLLDAHKQPMGKIFLNNGKVIIGDNDGTRGTRNEVVITSRLPGEFDKNMFTKAGGIHLSAAQYLQYWRFK